MSVNNEPNWVDPVINSVEEVIVCAIIVWAVNMPRTVKSSADEAVFAFEAVNAWEAYDDVPCNEPVNERATTLPLTFKLPVIWCKLLGFNCSFLLVSVSVPPAKNWIGKFDALPICKSLPVEYKYASFAAPIDPENVLLLIPILIYCPISLPLFAVAITSDEALEPVLKFWILIWE